jgi:hypothetical protein
MKSVGRLIIAACIIVVLLQLIRPRIPSKPATAELQAPAEVSHILKKDCYSCHSDERRLAWFDQIVPAYWLVRHDVLTARQHLNFSTLGAKPAAAQRATLFEAVNMVQLGAMPLPQFVALHPDAKVTPEELATLKAYLAPWAQAPQPAAAVNPSEPPPRVSMATVAPELDGFPFDPAFERWKPISTTDRGDNNTFRFILGNDIAVKAAQTGAISPWPDDARFAKIAWSQETGPDGLLHPGKFIQVELMVKDARRYKNTDGWGWGRWRTLDLKPYGEDARFVNECTACHQPVRGDDYVYTLPITAAMAQSESSVNNNAAALPAGLPYRPLAWSAITMYVDPTTRTTATLYGNDVAMQAVQGRGHDQGAPPGNPKYPAGSVLALVSWTQRDDPHWFGARIPDVPLSVEFVEVGSGEQNRVYRSFSGAGLTERRPSASTNAERVRFMLGLAPVQLP